jgi:hypothetical protein
MGLFKAFEKSMDHPIKRIQKTFEDQYPTWSIQHAQKLAHELAGVTLNEHEEAMLIDCLTGGHLTYINFTFRPKVEIFLSGGVATAISTYWSEWSLYFHMVADKFIKRRANKEKDGIRQIRIGSSLSTIYRQLRKYVTMFSSAAANVPKSMNAISNGSRLRFI